MVRTHILTLALRDILTCHGGTALAGRGGGWEAAKAGGGRGDTGERVRVKNLGKRREAGWGVLYGTAWALRRRVSEKDRALAGIGRLDREQPGRGCVSPRKRRVRIRW